MSRAAFWSSWERARTVARSLSRSNSAYRESALSWETVWSLAWRPADGEFSRTDCSLGADLPYSRSMVRLRSRCRQTRRSRMSTAEARRSQCVATATDQVLR
jgi:hypothetical protein